MAGKMNIVLLFLTRLQVQMDGNNRLEIKRKLSSAQNWQWHLKTNSENMEKQWWMPKKDIKTINLAVVLTQSYNNTSCVFGGSDYVSSLTFVEKKLKWWCENCRVLIGLPVFHFIATTKYVWKMWKKEILLAVSDFYFSPDTWCSLFFCSF